MITKKELFGIELVHYLKMSKKDKGKVLDALERQTKMHRGAIVRRFKQEFKKSKFAWKEKRGRPIYYTPDCIYAMSEVWETTHFACAELFHPLIKERVEILKREGDWKHSEEATQKLLQMSLGKLKKILPQMRTIKVNRGISTTTPSSIKNKVPLFVGSWRDIDPGSGQVDTVAHCGGSLQGDFIYSCGYTDVATGWSEYRAQWNKGQAATQSSLEIIKKALPTPLKMIHPDCGSEFLNHFVMDWCEQEKIRVTRSRSYHKNDNGYIEQKNGHMVRKWLGYERLGDKNQLTEINQFYSLLGKFYNHFQTQRLAIGTKKLKSGRIRKIYETQPKTPYQRMLESDKVSDLDKQKLKEEHEKLNPKNLHTELEKRKYAILTKALKFNKISLTIN